MVRMKTILILGLAGLAGCGAPESTQDSLAAVTEQSSQCGANQHQTPSGCEPLCFPTVTSGCIKMPYPPGKGKQWCSDHYLDQVSACNDRGDAACPSGSATVVVAECTGFGYFICGWVCVKD